MKTTLLSLAAIATLTLSASAATAQNAYTLNELNVTASQNTQLDKRDVPDSVTIISEEALKESRITNLAQALNRLGNIAMTQNGGAGTSASVFVRGMDARRTLVLIDGVRYNNPTGIGATAEFSQIMLYNVKQIEIIKGSQTGVWGADASAGVINIVTTKAEKGLHGVANVEYGSFDTKVASLQASYATDDFDVLMGGSIFHTDGFSAYEPVKSDPLYGKRSDVLGLEKDNYANKSFNAKLGWNITKQDRVEVSAQTIDSNLQFDGFHVDDAKPEIDLKNRFYALNYKHDGEKNDISFQYNHSSFDRAVYDKNFLTGLYETSNYVGSVDEVKLDDKFDYMKDSFIQGGVSYQKYAQKEVISNTDKDYTDAALFLTNYNKLQLISDLDTIVTESVRYDSYSAFDNALTGKIGAKQFVYNEYYISANIGTGYNVPTIGQLYGIYGPNEDLAPEKVVTSDITIGSDVIWVTGFYNQIDNLIDYVLVDPANYGYQYQNVEGKSILKGAEVGYKDYFFDLIGVSANYTYLDAKDADKKELARRPKHQADASVVYYATETWDLGLNAQYIGERYDGADKTGAMTGKYTVANFVTNVTINKFVSVYGKIDNLSDTYYQTVDGYATAGRSLYLGLNAKY